MTIFEYCKPFWPSFIKYTNYYSDYFSDRFSSNFLLLITTFSFTAISLVAVTLLLISICIPPSGESTCFLQRISAIYFIYYLWLENTGIFFRFSNWVTQTQLNSIILEIRQEDSVYYRFFFIFSLVFAVIFFYGVSERFFIVKKGITEFPILIFFILFGGFFAMRLYTFIDLLIALEIVTLASYVLVTFERQNRFSTYSGVQYFILGSLPSARLLLSFGFFYLQGGSLVRQDLDLLFNTAFSKQDFIEIKFNCSDYFIYEYIIELGSVDSPWFSISNISEIGYYFSDVEIYSIINARNPINALTLIALIFLFFNFIFKLTAAPFHIWAPNIYGKAPIVAVMFLSIYYKRLIFFLFFKFINTFLYSFEFFINNFLLTSGIFSILIGRIGAFMEKNIKRFFVYSSIGHVGFRLIGLSLITLEGASAIFHYLSIYILSSFSIWFLLITRGRNKTHLAHFAELKNNNPFISLLFAFLIFSISGIPPLGGFFIKLDVLAALLDTSHFFINYILFFFTVASFFYYLRIIKIIFFDIQEFNRSNQIIIGYANYSLEFYSYTGRLWIRSIIFCILGLYVFLVQKELLYLQYEVLSSFFLIYKFKLIAQLVRAHAW